MTVNKDNFADVVQGSTVPVLIDFWSERCAPCRLLSPIIAEIADENTDIKVCKINVDEEPELARSFNVMSIPLIVVMKNGKVTARSVGYKPKSRILAML